jgi:hypothetical protein
MVKFKLDVYEKFLKAKMSMFSIMDTIIDIFVPDITQCYGNILIEGEDNLSNLWFIFL